MCPHLQATRRIHDFTHMVTSWCKRTLQPLCHCCTMAPRTVPCPNPVLSELLVPSHKHNTPHRELTVCVELPDDGLDDCGSGGHVPPADRHGSTQHHNHHHYIPGLSLTALHCAPLSRQPTTACQRAPLRRGTRSHGNSRRDVTPLHTADSPPC
jgi:hypothetical protein